MFGRGLLFVERWDVTVVRSAIQEAFDTGTGPSWGDAAERLGRLAPWEYEYRHDDQVDRRPASPGDQDPPEIRPA